MACRRWGLHAPKVCGSARAAVAAGLGALLLGLVACGGGADVQEPPSAAQATLVLTEANREPAARAAAAALAALVGTGNLSPGPTAAGLPASLTSVRRWVAQGGAAPAGPGVTPRDARLLSARVLASGVQSTNCAEGGNVTLTVDDPDNNQQPSAGDVLRLEFRACQEAPQVWVDGSVTMTLETVGTQALPSLAARMDMVQLTSRRGERSLTLNGRVRVHDEQQTATTQRLAVEVLNGLVATVRTPAYTDTLTLGSGFWHETLFDTTAQAFTGSLPMGRHITLVRGEVTSASAGGSFGLFSTLPLTDYVAEPYPRSGVLRLTGRSGVLWLTVLNTAQVRTDLDVDADGRYETVLTVDWAWLI